MKPRGRLWIGLAGVVVVVTGVIAVISFDRGSSTRTEDAQSDVSDRVERNRSAQPDIDSFSEEGNPIARPIGRYSSGSERKELSEPSLSLDKVWVQPGDRLGVDATGLAPNSEVRISIRSEVVELGTMSTDPTGTALANVTIPDSFANDPGLHTIVANAIDVEGQPVEIKRPVRVGFDSTAPWIEAFGSAGAIRLSTDVVDVTSGGQVITMSSTMFDDLSGFDSGSMQWKGPNDTIFTCVAEQTFLFGGGVCTTTGGDDLNGTYFSPIVIPATSRPGTYELVSFSIRDNAGNQATYVDPSHSFLQPGAIDLTTLGYQRGSLDFTVTSSGIVDLSAPTLSVAGSPGALSLAPANPIASPQVVIASFGVQDDVSGFLRGGMTWTNGDRTIMTCIDKQTYLFGGGVCSRTAGDERDGTYSSPIMFPAYSAPGSYRFASMVLTDASGNRVVYYDPANAQPSDPEAVSITTLGYQSGAFDITVTGVGDTAAPTIASFGSPGALALSSNSVNTSTGSQTVTLSLQVSDNLSGFDSGSIQWANGDITIFSCVARETYIYGGGVCTRTSGDELLGTYSSPVRFPANGRAGTYKFMSLTLTDRSGNRVTYYDPENSPGSVGWVDLTTLGYRSGFLDITNGP